MAKSKSFFGLRKGSTKTMTFSVLRGQQITKDRVTDIANPKTMDQTIQRIPFAQAVKFYKQATRGLFRFAYEDKRPLESDYNAFMRHNVKYAVSVSLPNYRNTNYPALGNWLLSSGSLRTPDVSINDDALRLKVGGHASAITTVGALSSQILSAYPSYAEGDIVTFVTFNTSLLPTGLLSDELPPVMEFVQFIIDSASEEELASIGLADMSASDTYVSFENIGTATASAGAVIVSRNAPDGLRVSESFIVGNANWNTLMTGKQIATAIQGDAFSWGAADKAILQGSLAE